MPDGQANRERPARLMQVNAKALVALLSIIQFKVKNPLMDKDGVDSAERASVRPGADLATIRGDFRDLRRDRRRVRLGRRVDRLSRKIRAGRWNSQPKAPGKS
jgi:hypothetical protein